MPEFPALDDDHIQEADTSRHAVFTAGMSTATLILAVEKGLCVSDAAHPELLLMLSVAPIASGSNSLE